MSQNIILRDLIHSADNQVQVIISNATILLMNAQDVEQRSQIEAINMAAVKLAFLVSEFHRILRTASLAAAVMKEGAMVEEARAGSEEQALPCGTETILVVDDEEMVRKTVAAMLGHLGYTVITAECGLSALGQFAAQSGDCLIRLVITDLNMPFGMNGVELLKKLKELSPDLPVILLTGQAEDVSVSSGFAKVIRKPPSMSALTQAVREALNDAI